MFDATFDLQDAPAADAAFHLLVRAVERAKDADRLPR